jgi:hypothetical protein
MYYDVGFIALFRFRDSFEEEFIVDFLLDSSLFSLSVGSNYFFVSSLPFYEEGALEFWFPFSSASPCPIYEC